jgi:kynureninase
VNRKDGRAPIDPEALRRHYGAFLRPGRILLTGHSHQAWPDVARAGALRAFADAAEHADDKWVHAQAAAERVRRAVARRIDVAPDEIALGQNTHELVTRFLSALDFRQRPHLVTTSGEFHSLDRQLRRLAEEGVTVDFVEAEPVPTLAERLGRAVRPTTAALLASTVLFETSSIVPGLDQAVRAAQRVGAEVLLDAYHAFNVVPFRAGELGPEPVFVTAGGYKYAEWGEGCCFLRVPPQTALRPVFTGWFSDFEHLDQARHGGAVRYGARPADRFAGSTYDPTSHYRASAVDDFFEREELDVDRLRALSLGQTARILDALDGYDVLTPREAAARGGFVAVRVEDAARVVRALRERGVWVDSRGGAVRLGPAPYVTDAEIDEGVKAFRGLAPRPARAG